MLRQLKYFQSAVRKNSFSEAAFEKLARARLSLTDLPFPAQQRKMIVTSAEKQVADWLGK